MVTPCQQSSQNADEYYAERLPKPVEPVPAPVADEAAKPDAEGEKHEKPKKPIQPRINELVAERNSARDIATSEAQRADRLEAELADLKKKVEIQNTQAQVPEASAKPSRSQFATDDDYSEALTDWKVDQRLAERQKADAEEKMKVLQAQMADNWKGRADLFRSQTKDFDEVVGAAEVNLPQYLYDAIVESDIGPKLAYHFAKKPQDARRLMQMTPTAALREMGKLETRIGDDPPGKTVLHERSNAPEPIETLRNASNPVEKDPKKMSFQEHKAWRSKSAH